MRLPFVGEGKKMHWFKEQIRSMEGYVSPPQKEYRVKLNQNESPFDVPETIKTELLQQAKHLSWNRYPVNESPVLAGKLARRHDVEPRQILLGNGSNQLFQTLLTATLEPGVSVLYTVPTFSLYELYTDAYQGRKIEIPHPPAAEYPRREVMDMIIKEQPRLIYLCSPNNPTGFEMDLTWVKEICAAASGLVFFDEAYGEFTDQTAIPLLREHHNLIVSRTFSKAFSMAGLRFGYLISSTAIIDELRKVNLPYNINLFTELAASRLLDAQEIMLAQVKAIVDERERVYSRLRQFPQITVYPSRANFLLIRQPQNVDLFTELKQRGILVRNVSGYPFLQGHQRISVGFAAENDLFLNELAAILKSEKE